MVATLLTTVMILCYCIRRQNITEANLQANCNLHPITPKEAEAGTVAQGISEAKSRIVFLGMHSSKHLRRKEFGNGIDIVNQTNEFESSLTE